MFNVEMQTKLYNIFGFKKVTFDAASIGANGTFEQDVLFVEINQVESRVTQGNVYAKIQGTLSVYSQLEKLPYGFFSKKIQSARADDTKNFFFYDVDLLDATERMQNLLSRKLKFLYLYSAEHDPAHGQITSINLGENNS